MTLLIFLLSCYARQFYHVYRETKLCLPVVPVGGWDVPGTRADESGDDSSVLWMGRFSVRESAIVFNI